MGQIQEIQAEYMDNQSELFGFSWIETMKISLLFQNGTRKAAVCIIRAAYSLWLTVLKNKNFQIFPDKIFNFIKSLWQSLWRFQFHLKEIFILVSLHQKENPQKCKKVKYYKKRRNVHA